MELFRSICKIQTCKQIQQIREDSCINLTSNDTVTNTIPAFVGVLSHSKPLQTHVHPWESDVTLERERECVGRKRGESNQWRTESTNTSSWATDAIWGWWFVFVGLCGP